VSSPNINPLASPTRAPGRQSSIALRAPLATSSTSGTAWWRVDRAAPRAPDAPALPTAQMLAPGSVSDFRLNRRGEERGGRRRGDDALEIAADDRLVHLGMRGAAWCRRTATA